jgi:hypothetical protein
MRLDDHTTAHGGVIRKLGLYDKLVVPLAKILSLRGNPVVAAHPKIVTDAATRLEPGRPRPAPGALAVSHRHI